MAPVVMIAVGSIRNSGRSLSVRVFAPVTRFKGGGAVWTALARASMIAATDDVIE